MRRNIPFSVPKDDGLAVFPLVAIGVGIITISVCLFVIIPMQRKPQSAKVYVPINSYGAQSAEALFAVNGETVVMPIRRQSAQLVAARASN